MSKGPRHPITGRRLNGQRRIPDAPTLLVDIVKLENFSKPEAMVVLLTPPQVIMSPLQAAAFAKGMAEAAKKASEAQVEFERLRLAMPDHKAAREALKLSPVVDSSGSPVVHDEEGDTAAGARAEAAEDVS